MSFLQFLMDIGVHLMPFALLLYFPFRWIEYYTGGYHFHYTFNSLLYVLLWMTYMNDSASAGTVVSLLVLILFWDAMFLYFEKERTNREEEENQKWKHHTENEYNYTPGKRPENDTDPDTNQKGAASD